MCSYDIRSFWFIITHCNLPKRLVTLSGSLVKLSGSYVNICCMSHQLGNVSIQHKPWVPFGVILLIQRVHYYYWYSQMNLYLYFCTFHSHFEPQEWSHAHLDIDILWVVIFLLSTAMPLNWLNLLFHPWLLAEGFYELRSVCPSV